MQLRIGKGLAVFLVESCRMSGLLKVHGVRLVEPVMPKMRGNLGQKSEHRLRVQVATIAIASRSTISQRPDVLIAEVLFAAEICK